jgi:UDP-glucose 4-epimerase
MTTRPHPPTPPIVVTGGAGYLGGRIVRSLAAEHRPVIALTRRPAPWLASSPHILVEHHDEWTEARLKAVLRGAAAVIHLGGPNETVRSSVLVDEATRAADALRAAVDSTGVPRLVTASTVHVYNGDLAMGRSVSEATTPTPTDAYGVAQLRTEEVLAEVRTAELVVLRLANAVGPPVHASVRRWTLLVNDLCRQAVVDRRMVLRSDGGDWRDFLPLADVCSALTSGATGRLDPGIYN